MKHFLPLLFLLSAPGAAQEFRATLFGIVSDPSGAAVPAARVTVRNLAQNQTFSAQTNHQGQYAIPFLIPGGYALEAEAPGFRKLVYNKPLELRISDRMALSLTLELGPVTESVTVVAEAEQIETGSASMGQVVDTRKVQALPLNGRMVFMFLQLAPGVLFSQREFGASGFSGTRPFDVNGSWDMNGSRGNNEFLLDGAPNSVRGRYNTSPNVDAIEEFKVMTNTYDAQYGRTMGGIVNMTTKAGSSAFHGSAYDYLRNSVLDANTFQNNLKGLSRGSHVFNDFGGLLSGPARKEKTFFMFSYEGIREKTPFPRTASIPTMLERQGNFTQSGLNVFDPLTTRNNPAFDPARSESASNPRYTRDQFAGNLLPASRIHPIARNLVAYVPEPNLPGRFNNFLASPNNGIYNYNSYIARLDHNLNERNRVYGTYNFWHRDELRNSNGLPGPLMQGNYMQQRTVNAVVVDWVSTLSASTVYNLRLSANRFVENDDKRQNRGFEFSKLGFARNFTAPTTSRQLMPVFNPNRYTSWAQNSYYFSPDNTYALQTNLSKTLGRHVTKYGLELRLLQSGRLNLGNPAGSFDFSEGFTQRDPQRSEATAGSSIASLLLGYPSGGSINYNDSQFLSWHVWGFYVQDDWRVTRRLTVNLGARYDIEESFRERFNRVNAGFDYNVVSPINDAVRANYARIYPTIADKRDLPAPDQLTLRGGLLFAGVDGQPRTPYNIYWKSVQPRLGLAYRLTAKTVFRGGIGSYYYQSGQMGNTAGYQQSTSYITSHASPIPGIPETELNSFADPFPRGVASPPGNTLKLLTNIGQGAGHDTPDRKMPRVLQFSFGVQRDLPSRMNLDVSYVASRTHNYFTSQNLNDTPLWAQLKALDDTTYMTRQIANPFLGIAPVTTSLGANATVGPGTLLRAYPHFSGFSRSNVADGKLWYDALQIKIDKRFVHGLSAIFSYTYSKSMRLDEYKNSWAYDGKPTRAVSDRDTPHNLAFSGLYELPIARKRRLGGWQVQWIFTYASGRPIGITGAEYTGIPVKPVKHQWVYTPSGVPVLTWFNTYNIKPDGSYSTANILPRSREEAAAIGAPFFQRRPYQLNDAPIRLGALRNATVPQLNLSLIKETKLIRERATLQFRAESFNATNSPLFYGPSTDVNNRELFGTVGASQQQFSRNLQFGLKLLF